MDALIQRLLATRPSLGQLWHALRSLPGGPAIFSRFIAQISPQSAVLGAQVEVLEEGRVELSVTPKRSFLNAEGDVHAAVLINIAELASGLAVRYVTDLRGDATLKRIELECCAPARGVLTASCDSLVPVRQGTHHSTLHTTVRDADGAVVARVTSLWIIAIRSGE